MSIRLNTRSVSPAMTFLAISLFIAATFYLPQPLASQSRPRPPAVRSLRLYIFDCGMLRNLNPKTFGFDAGQLANNDAVVPCHLIVHPKGTLIWDTGVVPDAQIGSGARGADRAGKPLKDQLAAVGYSPADITYLAMSHYHSDHTANANAFSGATWLVRKAEREAMFAEKPPPIADLNHYNLLKDAKTIVLDKDEYDVFGDGDEGSKTQGCPCESPGLGSPARAKGEGDPR